MTDITAPVLEHLKCSHAALDQANAALTKTAEAQKQAAALIPEVVEALIKHDRIDPAQREKAAALLADPVQVLQILARTADPADTVRPRGLGTPAGPEKTAGAPGYRYTGQRTSEKTAADLAFEKALIGTP